MTNIQNLIGYGAIILGIVGYVSTMIYVVKKIKGGQKIEEVELPSIEYFRSTISAQNKPS
jgi:hypothetical protein